MSSGQDVLEPQRAVAEPGDVIVVCGLPGVGKSTVSRAIADRLDATVLRTDVIRREIVDNPVYTAEEKRRVYDELFERAGEYAAAGHPVVLDGTYRRREYRDRAGDLADALGAAFHLVTVQCDEATVERRIAEREHDASEADFEVYRQYRDSFEPLERDHATIDTSGDLDATRRQVPQLF
jgi:predicted kinase